MLTKKVKVTVFAAAVGAQNVNTDIELLLEEHHEMFELICRFAFGFSHKYASVVNF